MAAIKAFKKIFKNPIVLLPDLLLALFVILMTQLAVLISGVRSVIPEEAEELTIEILRDFFGQNYAQILWAIGIFFFITFVVGVIEKIIKLELITSIVKNKKPSLIYAWKNRKQFFWRIVLMKVYIFLILLLAIIVIFGVIGLIIYLLINPFNPDLSVKVSSVVTILLGIAALISIKLFFLFRYPIMFLTKTTSPNKVLLKSYKSFKKAKTFTFVTWMVTIGIAILFGFLGIILAIPQLTILSYVTMLTGVLHQTWLDMYIFLRFKQKS